MTIKEMQNLLSAEVYCCEHMLDEEILTACGSDMMSDVLAFVKDQAAMLSGLVNPQVVRTAEMMDMKCVVFVRGKQPNDAIITLAKEKSICILSSKYHMFTACGILYQHGLRGGEESE